MRASTSSRATRRSKRPKRRRKKPLPKGSELRPILTKGPAGAIRRGLFRAAAGRTLVRALATVARPPRLGRGDDLAQLDDHRLGGQEARGVRAGFVTVDEADEP